MRKIKARPGAYVRLTMPSATFTGMEPNPLPVGSAGIVNSVGPGGNLEISWDVGVTATHVEDEILVVKAAPRRWYGA